MRLRLASLLLAGAAALAACRSSTGRETGPAPPIDTGAAARADSVSSPAEVEEARISFAFYGPPGRAPGVEALAVRFDDGTGWRTVEGRDFTTRSYPTPHSPEYRLRTGDSVRVEVTLADGATAGRGTVALPVRRGWTWSVHVHVTDRNPLAGCFGCVGARSFPLRSPAPADSLFLVWGGNYIARPVIY